eukprot:929827-Pyramimonas_sp.AAC.1
MQSGNLALRVGRNGGSRLTMLPIRHWGPTGLGLVPAVFLGLRNSFRRVRREVPPGGRGGR